MQCRYHIIVAHTKFLPLATGENLLGKVTVAGVAENFPLISIGDLIRLRFNSPEHGINTEVVGEVADVIVKTEEVTIRLPSPFQTPNVTMGCLPYLQALLQTTDYVVDAVPLLQFGIQPSIQAVAINDINRKEMLDRFRFDVRFGFQGGRGFDIIVQSLRKFLEPGIRPAPSKKSKKNLEVAQKRKELHLNRSLLPTRSQVNGIVRSDDREDRLKKEIFPPLKFQSLVNLEQQQAVTNIAYGYHGQAPYIIEGPAGTGK
jgi:hypothetical protein